MPDAGFAWNHGGIQPEITTTFLGLVGPGVRRGLGDQGHADESDHATIEFSDHTDIRPTLLALLGLQDDYVSDGRVLFEIFDRDVLPHSLKAHSDALLELARVYKRINAPVGDLGQNSLKVSTAALASNTANDAMYTKLEGKIASWHTQRDSIANRMKSML
jgi:hypothetical protein